MIRGIDSAVGQGTDKPNGIFRSVALDSCTPRPVHLSFLPRHVERKIAARWKVWAPWVRMLLLRAYHSDPTVDVTEDGAGFSCFRERHSRHILAMLRAGISMRTIRRHRLDDPRLDDEAQALLVQAATDRQLKARFRRSEEQRKQDRLRTIITLGSGVSGSATAGPDCWSAEAPAQAVLVVFDPLAVQAAIRSIRQHVCEHFYLREMRDQELTVRNNRRAYVLPRQIAMYLARQLTGATLQEIGREFGNRHHTTASHAIRKIEEMCRADAALDRVIMQLMNACGW